MCQTSIHLLYFGTSAPSMPNIVFSSSCCTGLVAADDRAHSGHLKYSSPFSVSTSEGCADLNQLSTLKSLKDYYHHHYYHHYYHYCYYYYYFYYYYFYSQIYVNLVSSYGGSFAEPIPLFIWQN